MAFCLYGTMYLPVTDSQELAATKIRQYPTLPADEKLGAIDRGELWPRAFCAFVGCPWIAPNFNESQLHEHLRTEHAAELALIRAHMLRGNASDALLSFYNQAIAEKCRGQAPLAGCSLDRVALKSFSEASGGNKVEALVCFVCACVYTYVEELAEEGRYDVQWVKIAKPATGAEAEFFFLERPIDETIDHLSLKEFLQRYDNISGSGHCLRDHETFEDWRLTLPSNLDPAVCTRFLSKPLQHK